MLSHTTKLVGVVMSLVMFLPAGGGLVGVRSGTEQATQDWLCLIAPWLCS